MNRSVALRSLALVFTALCLFLAACGGKTRSPAVLIEEAGGNTLWAVTDEAGAIVTDSAGDILEYRAQQEGTALSQYVTAPSVYSYNGRIVCDLFAFTVPKGWEKADTPQIRLTQTGTDTQMELQALHNMTMERFLEFANAFFPQKDENGNAVAAPTVTDCSYLNLTGKKLEISYGSENGKVRYTAYALIHGENLIAFYLTGIDGQKPQADFDKLVTNMEVL